MFLTWRFYCYVKFFIGINFLLVFIVPLLKVGKQLGVYLVVWVFFPRISNMLLSKAELIFLKTFSLSFYTDQSLNM